MKNQPTNKFHWNTNEAIDWITKILSENKIQHTIEKLDMFVDESPKNQTEGIWVRFPNSNETSLFIRGWDEQPVDDAKNAIVSFVEITDCESRNGGLTSKEPKVVEAYMFITNWFEAQSATVIDKFDTSEKTVNEAAFEESLKGDDEPHLN